MLGETNNCEIEGEKKRTSTQIVWAMITAIDRSKLVLVPGICIMLWSPVRVFCRYSKEARWESRAALGACAMSPRPARWEALVARMMYKRAGCSIDCCHHHMLTPVAPKG